MYGCGSCSSPSLFSFLTITHTEISAGGVGLVFLADIAPTFLVKLTAPYWYVLTGHDYEKEESIFYSLFLSPSLPPSLPLLPPQVSLFCLLHPGLDVRVADGGLSYHGRDGGNSGCPAHW